MANQEQLARLRRSVKEWNQWRQENPNVEIALSDADLRYADLRRADLRRADLRRADLTAAELIEANLRVADLSGANLNVANLLVAELSGADFREANLSGANLREANLSGANLSEVNLNQVCLSGANLSGANLSGANLSGAKLMEANLIDANLSGANLREADLSEANLSYANLSGADLSEANLSEAKALNTNFTRTNLTGACIRDWNINQGTVFEEVICDYIYLAYYQERRPRDPNKIFNLGDFQRLIETARETVDLIFSDGIDWKAFLESFHGLQIESENSDLSIAGILKKRDGTFVIQIDAPHDTDKAELEKRFYQKYNKLLQQARHYYQKLQLAERDIQSYQRENTNLMKIITRQPMIYANNIGVGVNQGEIQGNAKVAGILNEAEQQNLTEIITEVQAIITPLAQTYPNDKTMQGIKTIEVIKNDPNLKQKLINAAQKGGLEFLKKSFDNPVGALIGGAIEGWMGK
jgi:uncharacterized protein YjbI with pentapeptide repeats